MSQEEEDKAEVLRKEELCRRVEEVKPKILESLKGVDAKIALYAMFVLHEEIMLKAFQETIIK